MSVHVISFMLVVSGITLLCLSLLPTRTICLDQNNNSQVTGWKALFVLTILFIIGYILFSILLFKLPDSIVVFTVSLILLGGSVFVFLVARMSLGSIEDITRIAALERHHALHDGLTNLPNRTLLNERIKQAIVSVKRTNTCFTMMLMDLNQFKEINDTLGHHCGDSLLQQVAPRLKAIVRESDTVARLGGDEFAVVLRDTDSHGAILLCEKILSVLENPFTVEGHTLKIGMSIGIATYPNDAEDHDTLLQHADVAMYVAKKDASGYAVYDAARDQHSVNRLKVVGELHDAIKKKKLTFKYQPIFKTNNQKIWGFEVLSRWMHPELGEIEPADFISIAEQSSLIKELTIFMLESSFQQFRSFLSIEPDVCISVNLSVKDIQDADFATKMKSLLERYSIQPASVNLELTESIMMSDSQRAYEVMTELSKMGLNISIDDFGTGFSSLSYLKQLPTNSLKIDRSFVSDIMEDENDAVIVRSTIDLAHNMGRTVIAEGVENKDILDILDILGCDYVQGYFLCEPLDSISAENLLRQNAPDYAVQQN